MVVNTAQNVASYLWLDKLVSDSTSTLVVHANVASIDAVSGLFDSIDPIAVAVSLTIILVIIVLTSFVAGIVDRMLKNYIPRVVNRVEVNLTLRHTVIRTLDNRRIIVPNSTMSTEPIINWSIRQPEIIWTLEFNIPRISDIDSAREIILQSAKSHPHVLQNREIKVLLTSAKPSDLVLTLYIHVPERIAAEIMSSEIRVKVVKEFERAGINIKANE
jgi:hypothetical protein